ncbi:MAG: aldehyde dehydrogenase family protein, partial [Burkholderiales bacterium]
MKVHDKHYINGAWTPSRSAASIEVRNAATEEVIARVPAGTADDADQAARAARVAFGPWAATPVAQRAALLQGIADGLAARADEIARAITAEVGMPLKLSRRIQAALPPQVMASTAQLVREYPFEER